jgi:hypothetical protein
LKEIDENKEETKIDYVYLNSTDNKINENNKVKVDAMKREHIV